MTTIHKNFKTISGGTLINVLYEYYLEKNPISHDSISLRKPLLTTVHVTGLNKN
jgi:hypothetical protein